MPRALASQPYPLHRPRPGWAEQNPEDWWSTLVTATHGALAVTAAGIAREEIVGLGADCTSCTVVAMDRALSVAAPGDPLDGRAGRGPGAAIAASGHPALKYNGYGNVSAEWMPCKALWLKENEPEIYRQARHIGECIDWLTHRLTGEWVGSINNASVRWYYDRAEAAGPPTSTSRSDWATCCRVSRGRILNLGEVAGTLLPEVAAEFGCRAGIPVAEGGVDAFVAMIGLNVLRPGGWPSSPALPTSNWGRAGTPFHAAGIFGAYPDAVVPGQYTVEGGQVSTGSVVKWFKDNFCGREATLAAERGVDVYTVLNELAAPIPPGSEGLVVLDYWQGNRTPYVDAEARGVIRGLSLKHTTGHLYRAIIEGIAYGTEHILRTFRAARLAVDEMVAAGGPTPESALDADPCRCEQCAYHAHGNARWPGARVGDPGRVADGLYPKWRTPQGGWSTRGRASRVDTARRLRLLCRAIHRHLPAAAVVDP